MKTRNYFALLLLLTGSALACSTAKTAAPENPGAKHALVGDYQYTGYDGKGVKIVEGRLSITSVEQRRIGTEEQTQIKGNWQLNKVGDPQRIGMQVGSGELIGSIIKEQIIINLNPNVNDANVGLQGTLEGKRLHGTWAVSGIAGVINKGTFEATKK